MLVYQRVGISRRYLGLPRFHCFGPIMADLLPEKSAFKCSNHPLLKNYWCSRDPLHSPNVSSNQSVERGYQFNHCCSMLSSHKATCLLVRFPLLKCWVSKCDFKSQLLMLEPPLLLVESRFLTVTFDFVWLNSAFWSFCWNPWVLHVESPWIPRVLVECPYLGQWNPWTSTISAHLIILLRPWPRPADPAGPAGRAHARASFSAPFERWTAAAPVTSALRRCDPSRRSQAWPTVDDWCWLVLGWWRI